MVGRIPGFPEGVKQDGSCEHLTENNECKIYETRPLVCRIDDQDFKAHGFPTREAWYEANYKACDSLIQIGKQIKGENSQ